MLFRHTEIRKNWHAQHTGGQVTLTQTCRTTSHLSHLQQACSSVHGAKTVTLWKWQRCKGARHLVCLSLCFSVPSVFTLTYLFWTSFSFSAVACAHLSLLWTGGWGAGEGFCVRLYKPTLMNSYVICFPRLWVRLGLFVKCHSFIVKNLSWQDFEGWCVTGLYPVWIIGLMAVITMENKLKDVRNFYYHQRTLFVLLISLGRNHLFLWLLEELGG